MLNVSVSAQIVRFIKFNMYKAIKIQVVVFGALFLLLPSFALAFDQYQVFNCGTALADGIYTFGGTANGQPYYVQDVDPTNYNIHYPSNGNGYYLVGDGSLDNTFPLYYSSVNDHNVLSIDTTAGGSVPTCSVVVYVAPVPTPTGGGFPTTTVSVVDNPTQDVFNGVVLYCIGLFGIVWFFRKQK